MASVINWINFLSSTPIYLQYRKRSLSDCQHDDLDNTRDSVLSDQSQFSMTETNNNDPELMIIDFEYCAYNYSFNRQCSPTWDGVIVNRSDLARGKSNPFALELSIIAQLLFLLFARIIKRAESMSRVFTLSPSPFKQSARFKNTECSKSTSWSLKSRIPIAYSALLSCSK